VSPYIKVHGRYSQNDLESLFDDTDALIAPSVGYETFGYTVLEALSYGVPVIVSSNVGAKDIIPDGCGIIVDIPNSENLKKVISGLTSNKLVEMNRNIMEKANICTLSEINEEIITKCYLN